MHLAEAGFRTACGLYTDTSFHVLGSGEATFTVAAVNCPACLGSIAADLGVEATEDPMREPKSIAKAHIETLSDQFTQGPAVVTVEVRPTNGPAIPVGEHGFITPNELVALLGQGTFTCRVEKLPDDAGVSLRFEQIPGLRIESVLG